MSLMHSLQASEFISGGSSFGGSPYSAWQSTPHIWQFLLPLHSETKHTVLAAAQSLAPRSLPHDLQASEFQSGEGEGEGEGWGAAALEDDAAASLED